MRLLLFVILTWHCIAALKANYTPAETEAIDKLEEDTKGLDSKIDNLIKSLNDRTDKNVKPAQGEKELDKTQIGEVTKVIEELKKFKNGTIPAKFNVNAINDLFPNNNTANVFIAVKRLLENADKAVKYCLAGQQCTHPLAKLYGEKGADKAKNVKLFETAEKAYSNRDTEQIVLEKLPSLLMKFPIEFSHFHSYIDYQLAKFPGEAKRILSVLPKEFALPNMTDAINSIGQQQPGVREVLSNLTTILQNVGSVLDQCRKISTGSDEVPCSKGDKIPLVFTLDPSNIQALKTMVTNYEKRPLGPDSVPTTVDPKAPSNSTNAPVVDSSSVATTAASTDNNGGHPKPDDKTKSGTCCQLCLLPAMPASQGNCQSGNQCNCGCSCSGNTRGCRAQSKCCSSSNHCKDNCCEKGHHEDKKPVVHTEVITIPSAKASSSSSSMAAFISAVSLIATLLR